MSNIKSIFESLATKAKKFFAVVKSVFKKREELAGDAVSKAVRFFDENPWSGFVAFIIGFMVGYLYVFIGLYILIPLNLGILGTIIGWFVWFKVVGYLGSKFFTFVVCGVEVVKQLTTKSITPTENITFEEQAA